MAPTDVHGLVPIHFFAWNLPQSEQIQLIQTLASTQIKVLRIFIATIDSKQAGSNAMGADDLERYQVGKYDDNVLNQIDQLIVNLAKYGNGMKLIIALHDRYSLGCYAYKRDAYTDKYQIPAAQSCSPPNDASNFYTNSQARQDMYIRARHILTHVNPYYNRQWGSLSQAIFSIQIENESQGHMNKYTSDWLCDLSIRIRPLVSNGVLLSSGGGTEFGNSLRLEYFQCKALDLIGLHDYTTNYNFAVSKVKEAVQLAQTYGKRVYVEEFGDRGDKQMESALNSVAYAAHGNGVPWVIWQVVPNARWNDFEFFTQQTLAWAAFRHQANSASGSPSPWSWPEIWGA
ncbi:unnamed protein product [Didymodactylos carnosus]|uniref:mannan endo-1,4-beta-mannosidase n=2 Tax=Didymodactylos carnosus TaxID=1234261 RepID=A0A815KMR0_9BILA|nr:unnamed protein product [Didymodactylos carnosus]CAF4292313.1 unnamed protein product [Didymodactylos carnosus]